VANDQAVAASSGRVPGTTELSSSERETGALATGVTGTIDLPDLPIPAGTMVDVGVVATQPFSMAGASLADRDRAMQCLTAAIYYEAASEPDEGRHVSVAPVVPPTPQMFAAATVGAVPGTELARARPVVRVLLETVVSDRLPPGLQILERWKDSGKPLK